MKDEVRKAMKKEYDFSNARKNPYADRVKQQITINLNQTTIQYFKDLAEKTGLPYQTLTAQKRNVSRRSAGYLLKSPHAVQNLTAHTSSCCKA